MKKETIVFSGHNGVQLPAIIWKPEAEVKAVLQITHGMTEHMERYDTFAAELCKHGIAAAGFDLRGHGKNSGDPQLAAFGEHGWEASLEDMKLFRQLLKEEFSDVPHAMLGFSLGSFLLREYLGKYPDDSSAAIIMGTGHQPGWLLSVMISIVNGQIKKAGLDGSTDLIKKLSFGTYNQKFKPNRTEADWLCADQQQLDEYLKDPLVRKNISAGLFRDLLASMKRSGKVSAYDTWNKNLPVLLISGQDDPVGDSGKGVQKVYQQMQKAGMKQTELRMIGNARHDVLHEKGNSIGEVCRWLLKEFDIE